MATEKTADLADDLVAEFGENATYVADLLARYRQSPDSVDEEWREFFRGRLNSSGGPAGPPTPQGEPAPQPAALPVSVEAPRAPETAKPSAPSLGRAEEALPLRGGALRIAENMEASLLVPTASSQRQIPIKLLDENRRLINVSRAANDESKISFTQLVAWAIVQALKRFPRLNDAYDASGGTPVRIRRDEIRFGLAVDVEKPDGSRTLLVPNVRGVEKMGFADFAAAEG